LISIISHGKIIVSRGTLGFEHSEPGQDWKVAALRSLFDAKITLRLFISYLSPQISIQDASSGLETRKKLPIVKELCEAPSRSIKQKLDETVEGSPPDVADIFNVPYSGDSEDKSNPGEGILGFEASSFFTLGGLKGEGERG